MTAMSRPGWKRFGPWLALLAVVLLGAAVVTALSSRPGRPLDPDSAQPDGSKALAHVLEHYGVAVSRVSSIAAAAAAPNSGVLVVAPDDYSAAQLRQIGEQAERVILLAPGQASVDALVPGITLADTTGGHTTPGCGAAGPVAAGTVDLPDATRRYSAPAGWTSCYDGALLLGPRVAVLGSSALLRNDTLARDGVAALDVNTLSADRGVPRVVWLMPSADAAGAGAPSVWQLFPDGVHRAFAWLLALGVLLVLWRSRRLGPVVAEPLPVVVRAAEVVEGHGRLYRRAHARDRAAAALRAASAQRLARRLGLQRGLPGAELAAAVAPVSHRPQQEVLDLLSGAVPTDDGALVRLAGQLDALERAAGVADPRPKRGPA